MADTARSKTDILALFADNAIGAISEQDLRDFVVSLLGEYAGIYVIGGSTNQVVSATPAKMVNWTENGLSVGPTPDYANNEITANTAGVYRVDGSFMFSGSNGKIYYAALYKDSGSGFVDAGAPRMKRKLDVGGDVGSTAMHGYVSLNPTDKICVYVWSSDGGIDFTIEEAAFSMKRVG